MCAASVASPGSEAAASATIPAPNASVRPSGHSTRRDAAT
jgi:hypothetical protein